MGRKILITAGPVRVEATLNETATARAILGALPISALASTWGDEIYFGIPVDVGLEDRQETVEMGELGYWPPGRAFCIFFGRTPASRGDEIRPASAVTIIGKASGDVTVFRQVGSGSPMSIELAED